MLVGCEFFEGAMTDTKVTYYADFETANLTKIVTVASGNCCLDVTIGAAMLIKRDEHTGVRFDLYIRNTGGVTASLAVKAAAWLRGEMITTTSTSAAGIEPGSVRTDYFVFAMDELPDQIMGQLQVNASDAKASPAPKRRSTANK